MGTFKAPKGTKDIFYPDIQLWQKIYDTAKSVFHSACYQEIRTPAFEATELFTRGVGTSTDVVNKEMYTFEQKGRMLTLRPENTAGVVRAYLENNFTRLPKPVKLWYFGPMFRYERPQLGRQRQFHQVGIEIFGIKEPLADAETISLAYTFLNNIGVTNLSLDINTIGCDLPECRPAFKEKFKKAIQGDLPHLCADCNVRYEKNPLRILDCKVESCKKIIASDQVTSIFENNYVCSECQQHFEILTHYLKTLGVNYKMNRKLVRGLDYYTRTVFEITAENLGAQNAVCGGGRYDNLVSLLGGSDTPAVGWALGLERLIDLIDISNYPPLQTDIFIVSDKKEQAISLTQELRQNGFTVDLEYGDKSFSKQLEKAVKLGAKLALIYGENEIQREVVQVKNLETSQQDEFSLKHSQDAYKALKNLL